MNKLYSKIAALSVGLAMAIGVGVAVGSREAKVAKAATYVAYTLDGRTADSSEGSSSGYATESLITQSEVQWGVYGNTTMGPWRIGGLKKAKSADPANTADRTISSKSAVTSQEVERVKLEVGAASSITVNSLKLYVGTAEGLHDISEVAVDFTANSTMTFDKPSGDVWANRFFTVIFNLTNNTTSNKFVEFKTLSFEYEVSVQDPDTITVSGANEVAIGDSVTMTSVCTKSGSSSGVNQNVVWSSSNAGVAKVNQEGIVIGVTDGTATIYATAENAPTIVGSKEITVTGGKTDDLALVISPADLPTAYGDNYVALSGVYAHVKQVMNNGGIIQIQKTNGLIENVGALPYDISEIEISFNAEKTQGTGFAIKASTDGETFVSLENEQIRTNRFAYSAPSTGYVYFQITAPTSGTLYLDEILINLGNADEAKMVTLATSLNTLLDAECAGDSDSSAITAAKWAEVEAAYTDGDETAKADLKAVEGLSYIEVNQFLSRYDYIVGTYGYNNFLERTVSSSSAIRVDSGLYADNNTMIIVISIAAISALAFTTLLVFKKKRQK